MYDINELLAKNIFWTKQNGRDELMCVGRQNFANTLDEIILPSLSIKYEEGLKQLGIPYEIDGNRCLIHDPDVEEYQEITSPFMTILEGRPKQISNIPLKYTGKIPTNNMLKAANSYYKKVREDLKQLLLPKEQKHFDEYFEKENKDGIVLWNGGHLYSGVLSISDIFSGEWGSKYLRVSIWSGMYSEYHIVIEKSTVKGRSQITLNVPFWAVKQLIGYGGQNAKDLARKLGVCRVNIRAQ